MTPCTRGSQEGLVCFETTGFGLCHGLCASGACAELCVYCDGFCSLTGCNRRDGTGICPAP